MEEMDLVARARTKSCPHCSKTYVMEHAFKIHVVRCRLLKSQGDGDKLRAGHAHGVRDLYALVSSLAAKVEHLEAKLERVAARAPVKAHRLSHQELLSETAPDAVCLSAWLKRVEVEDNHLQDACDARCATEVLRHVLEAACKESRKACPFRRIEEAGSPVYVLTREGWEVLDGRHVECARRDLVHKLQRQFKSWQDKNVGLLTDEAFSMTFTANLLVVMSDSLGPGGSVLRALRETIASAAPAAAGIPR